jgi:type IV secretory pathway VirB3-like protein
MSAPTLGFGATNGAVSFQMMLVEFVSNKIVLSSLLISAIIVILFLSLKIAGVFGK